MSERAKFRRHAMLGLQVKGYFPSDPEALLLNDAYYEFVEEGIKLPSWFASAYSDPEAFKGEHIGVLRRLRDLTTPEPTSEKEEDRKAWNAYKEWAFDSSGVLWDDDPRTPRERLTEYFAGEEEVEWE